MALQIVAIVSLALVLLVGLAARIVHAPVLAADPCAEPADTIWFARTMNSLALLSVASAATLAIVARGKRRTGILLLVLVPFAWGVSVAVAIIWGCD